MTMIERVARAICHEQGKSSVHWTSYVEDARGALLAMREPTDFMISKGMWSRSASGTYSPHEIAMTIYQAMIDAALNEKE